MNATMKNFGHPDTLIRTYDHWCVQLRPQQVTLGSLVLICSEPVQRFSDVSPAGMTELHRVIGAIESALSAVFQYDKINYLMLMMVDPDVHFHVIPRYGESREFEGREFSDQGWPGPPDLASAIALPDDVNQSLIARLRSHGLSE